MACAISEVDFRHITFSRFYPCLRYFWSLFRKKDSHPLGDCLFLDARWTRTHLHGTVRWTVPATSSKTGGNNNFCPSGAKMQIESYTRTIDSAAALREHKAILTTLPGGVLF